MIKSIQDYVDGIYQILDTNLQDFLDDRETSDYPLTKPKWYRYEKKTFETLPAGIIIGTDARPRQFEMGSDIVETEIVIGLTVSASEEKLARYCYLYEASIRECLRHNKEYNGINYVWRSTDFSMQIERGSQLYKIITMRFNAINQEVF